jgi:tetratricopeptide (TPR) repeat protein
MLTLAHDAEETMVVAHRQDNAARIAEDDNLFQLAVDRLLRQADPGPGRVEGDWALRSQGYGRAADIVQFTAYMSGSRETPDDLYRAALAELRPADPGARALDPMNEVLTTYRRVRGLRASTRVGEALELAQSLSPKFFFGSGAEPRRADIQFEIGACLLTLGRVDQVFSALGGSEEDYWGTPATEVFSTRHRYDYVLGLAEQARDRTEEAVTRLESALDHFHAHRLSDVWHDVYELSLTLTLAEFEARDGRGARRAAAALNVAERIQGRWGVIARTQTPLAVAFRRIYGDVALLVSSLPRDPAAARLGLKVCLSAKQTGFAGHLRAGESLLPAAIADLVQRVLAAEQEPAPDFGADPDVIDRWKVKRASRLAELRRSIESRVNPVLADMLLPVPADIDVLLSKLRERSALDFTGLTHTSGEDTIWFRTLIEPSGTVTFERFEPGAFPQQYAEAAERPGIRELDRVPWREMAHALLPAALCRRLARVTEDAPLELVISAHRELSLLPWAALRLDDGVRLVRRALLTQTPVLTCLVDDPLAEVSGPALVRLVSQEETSVAPDENGVWVELERDAWGLAAVDGRVALSHCALDDRPPVATAQPRFSVALADGDWGFAHIATHGHGTGLEQYLWIPEETETGGLLSAGQAMGLRWPESTLMASCDVGKLLNTEDAEPLGFVMAVLTGNGRCVVAAVDRVPNRTAGELAAHIVSQGRRHGVRLDQALRSAQLASEMDDEPVRSWALFNAYIR